MKNVKEKKESAILYVRTATQKPGGKEYSISRQKELLISHCKKKDIEVKLVVEDFVSGLTFERPGINNLLKILKKGKIQVDYLIFTSWDRFSRSAVSCAEMAKILERYNVKPTSLKREYDFQQLVKDGEVYIENTKIRKAKSLAGIERAKSAGRWVSNAPFGYDNGIDENNIKTIIPNKHSEIVRWLFTEFSVGNTDLNGITKKLNQKGLFFSEAKVKSILQNPIYIGKVLKKKKDFNKDNIIDGIHSPIVSVDLFERVQSIINNLIRDKE